MQKTSRFPTGRFLRAMTPQKRPGVCSKAGICSFLAIAHDEIKIAEAILTD